jgi:polygalacturonase
MVENMFKMKNNFLGFKPAFYAGLVFLLLACSGTREIVSTSDELYKGVEFDMPRVKEPVIPGYTVKITDFGAVSGGLALNTKAFADAIDAVSGKGGGKVIIPSGIWLTGPVVLKSNLELHTESGAIVLFSKDKDLYPLVETSFEGLNTWRCLSPLTGKDLENIALTGEGVWDGSGDAWRHVKKEKLTEAQWKKLVASGGCLNDKKNEWYPSEQYRSAIVNADMNVNTRLKTKKEFEAIRDFLRPVMVSLVNCRKVLLDGPTFQNSPAWCIHPMICEDLTVRNVTVRNPWYSQNGDGIDIESCRNVVVHHSNFDVGDDAICIKSGKDKVGRDRGIQSENIVIKNCIVYHGHGGVTVGSEMSGGVRNLHVSDCSFIGTDVGLRFKSNRGRGGIVENIYMSKINMVSIPAQAISIDLFYGGKSASEMLEDNNQEEPDETLPVTEETPLFRNIFIRDIICKGAYQAIFMQGLPEMNLDNIQFENILMEADKGISCKDANHINIKGLKLVIKKLPAFDFTNSRNVVVEDLNVSSDAGTIISVKGKRSENIIFKNFRDAGLEKRTKTGPEVGKDQVKFVY